MHNYSVCLLGQKFVLAIVRILRTNIYHTKKYHVKSNF